MFAPSVIVRIGIRKGHRERKVESPAETIEEEEVKEPELMEWQKLREAALKDAALNTADEMINAAINMVYEALSVLGDPNTPAAIHFATLEERRTFIETIRNQSYEISSKLVQLKN